MRDAFHQAAVADEHVGAVIDDRMTGPVELGGEQALGERHADGVGQALPQRAGGGFDARRDADLGMSGRLRVQLPEALDFVERQVVAGQMEQARTAASSRGRSTARSGRGRATRMRRVVAQMPVPQRDRDVGHAHRHAGMSALRGLDGIHRERADRIGEFGIGDDIRDGGSGSGHGLRSVEGDCDCSDLARHCRRAERAVSLREKRKIIAPASGLCNNYSFVAAGSGMPHALPPVHSWGGAFSLTGSGQWTGFIC